MNSNRKLALAGTFVLIFWQLFGVRPFAPIETRYAIRAATGMEAGVSRFLYFYRYLGLFPLAPLTPPLLDDKAAAKELLDKSGGTLLTEIGHYPRHGQPGLIWLYLPHAWATGTTLSPRLEPFHALMFVLALAAMYASLVLSGSPVLGILLAIFIGSNPFQLHEVYANENIFGWPITTMLFLLALHFPLMTDGTRRRYALCAALMTGIALGTMYEIRIEPVLLLLSVSTVYLSLAGQPWRARLLPTVVLWLSFSLTTFAWQHYFARKTEVAVSTVSEKGGSPFRGPRQNSHSVWHPLFCGLGDFGAKHGYQWNDSTAYAYAAPLLRQRFGYDLVPVNPYCFEFHNVSGFSHSADAPCDSFELLNGYDVVLKEKILTDVVSDPVWIAGVFTKRAVRVIKECTPAQIRFGRQIINIPWSGFAAVAVAFGLVVIRARKSLLLLMFSVPLSLTSLLIYSGGGTCYVGCFHLIAAAIFFSALIERALMMRNKHFSTS